jgi:hypothetical protein
LGGRRVTRVTRASSPAAPTADLTAPRWAAGALRGVL